MSLIDRCPQCWRQLAQHRLEELIVCDQAMDVRCERLQHELNTLVDLRTLLLQKEIATRMVLLDCAVTMFADGGTAHEEQS